MLFMYPFIYRSPDEAGGGGGNDGNDNNNGQNNQQQPPDPNQAFQSLLERNNNDARAVANLLFTENYTYRQELRQAQQQLQDAQGRIPREGSVVLDNTQATLWQQYQTLGTPEQLTQTIRTDLIRQAAEAHGYKASALDTLARNLPLELRQEEVDGQTVPMAYVLQGENNAIRLDQYAQTHWPDFLPSLTAAPGASKVIKQTPSGKDAQEPNTVKSTLGKRYARPDKA